MRILVVDDARIERERLRGLLLRQGHEVVSATNGVEALDVYSASRPDLVLLDVAMPVMDGLETARRLRQVTQDHWTPILFCSGNTEPEDIAAGIEAGGDDYLSKPINDVVLAAKIMAMQRIANMKTVLAQVSAPAVKQGIADVAEVDEASGFSTRAAGLRMLAREFSRCSRSSQPISLLVVAVDRFSTLREAHGTAAAEQCLHQLAVALQTNASRMADFGFRHSDNVLAAILPDTPMTGAVRVAERVRSTINELDQLLSGQAGDQPMPQFTISAGVATAIPDKDEECESLLAAAEGMRQQAMDAGGDSVLATAVSVPFRLTTRELECLQWSALGKTSWEISCILEVSEAAINFHMTNIRAKFAVGSRRQAVALAIRYGLIRAA